MNLKNICLAIGAVSAVVVIASCGGSPAPSAVSSSGSTSTGGFTTGGTSTGGTTTGSGTSGSSMADGPGPVVGNLIPASVRYPAMQKVADEYQTLRSQGLDAAAADEKLLEFVRSDSDFTNSGRGLVGAIWARFPDNTYFVFDGHSTKEDPSDAEASAPAALSRPIPPASLAHAADDDLSVNLADGSNAILFDSFDGHFYDPNDEIAKMLGLRGYSVQNEKATLENLRVVNNATVLFFAAHGMTPGTKDGQSYSAIWSGTVANPQNDEVYADDIKAGRLLYGMADTGDGTPQHPDLSMRYLITAAWIKYYNWTFTKHSVAFLDFCFSSGADLTNSLRGLPSPVGTTLGWSNEAYNDRTGQAAMYLFDRCLGTGVSESAIPPLPGKGRPFPVTDVYYKMDDLGYDDSDATDAGAPAPAHLELDGFDLLLAPSVANMETYDPGIFNGEGDKTKLIIHGMFGPSAPSKVTVGGTEVTFKYVNYQELDCDIPDKPGPGYAGPVQISTSDGVTSNAPSLTWWSGSFKYTGNPVPNLTTAEMDIDANFRCDIHKYRTEVDGNLQDPAQSHARTSLDTVDKWSQSSLPPGYTLITSLTGTYSLGLDGTSNKPWGTGFDLEFYVDRKGGTIKIAYSYLGTDVLGTVPPATKQIPFLIPPDLLLTVTGYNGVDKYGWGMLKPKMDLNLSADDFTTPQVTFKGSDPPEMNTTFVCPAMTPQYAPTPDAEEDQPSS